MKKITVNQENNSVELTIALPFKRVEAFTTPSACPKTLLIEAFLPRIQKALEARMAVCYENLVEHMNTIVYNDGRSITYKRKNGTLHTFSMSSYELMEALHHELNAGASNTVQYFRSNVNGKRAAYQLVKALAWVKDKSDSGNYTWDDLFAYVLEMSVLPKEKDNF